jgi:hypothetical protein
MLIQYILSYLQYLEAVSSSLKLRTPDAVVNFEERAVIRSYVGAVDDKW